MLIFFIFLLITILFVGMLYQKYLEKYGYVSEEENYKAIQYHILSESELVSKSKKPIIWIYVPYEYNSRNWQSFGSRSSCNLNQPYLYLTVQSIIKTCEESFMICLIDDNSFKKLLPSWNIDLGFVGDPLKSYIRQLGMSKLVYEYGGFVLPISFLSFKNLDSLYTKGTRGNKMFLGENIDNNITSTHYEFYPNISFMGANKENETLGELIEFMQRVISSDYTDQANFLGDFNRWCNKRSHKINIINGQEIGIKNLDEEPVLIENLLGNNYINYYSNMYGIWIPDQMILKRTKYEWFARMSAKQIMESDFILAKYMLIASAPDSHLGVLEPLENKPNWVSFWRVPSGAPVWGMKPLNLGSNVPREKYGT